MITCGKTNNGEIGHCVVTKVSITYNIMHYEGVPVSIYYIIVEFASVQIIFGATVLTYKNATCCSYGCVSFFAECINQGL